MTRLTDDAIEAALVRLPGWHRDGEAIVRIVALKGFMRPLLLANAIGHLADQADHHPELTVAWGSLTIRLWTHVAGGLTQRDFDLAERIDRIVDVPR
ncbi:4a-hydroxytetrahydrobiopterin dehydratase [Enterovirga rhinocerotis]|uniref:4a-hydroxytetrahydrobiopterin dehydratase n=1 Tax=Enterovirga rhinocerotis TaxID=1339210 RepID=A0A4R7C8N1_9HYPH|nr:4a-hydroxytetrahydrobiopterin dehydratase [Enterovirga rhinocerotis]TDR93665.1 4a-hydroxytetrahydrobiopterin dehydratase [Enterovirga rhinocerotis]